jgi:hypothetical protein
MSAATFARVVAGGKKVIGACQTAPHLGQDASKASTPYRVNSATVASA